MRDLRSELADVWRGQGYLPNAIRYKLAAMENQLVTLPDGRSRERYLRTCIETARDPDAAERFEGFQRLSVRIGQAAATKHMDALCRLYFPRWPATPERAAFKINRA
jgi:hypothetical protein